MDLFDIGATPAGAEKKTPPEKHLGCREGSNGRFSIHNNTSVLLIGPVTGIISFVGFQHVMKNEEARKK